MKIDCPIVLYSYESPHVIGFWTTGNDRIQKPKARLLGSEKTEAIIATTNVSHLSRFITALDWQAID